MLRVLFIGDIVGESGRKIVKQQLPLLKEEHKIDFVIANGENAAHGKGLTPKIFHELLSYGIEAITMGNHTYAKASIYDIIDDPRIIRPLNMMPNDQGSGIRYFTVNDQKIGIVNLMGQAFMERDVEDPFELFGNIPLLDIPYIIDFHGETTSEKILFAHYFHELVSAVIGTHTHVQTADERLINGCAFISDVGMCGAYESILGRDIDEVFSNVLFNERTHYQIATGPALFCGVIIDIDNKKAINIKRIQIRPY